MWQAKLEKKPQLIRKLKADLSKLDEARFAPKVFILATGLDRDSKIQDTVAELSTDRQSQGLCPVEVLFWDEIREIILSNDELFMKHYPDLVVRDVSVATPPKAPTPPSPTARPPAATPKPSVENPLPLMVTEASAARLVPHHDYQHLWMMLHLAKMCPGLSRSQMDEIKARLMTAEYGIESDGNWASGRPSKIGDDWKYPNGNYANIADGWKYLNGNYANIGDDWKYPNGNYANIGDDWKYPNGRRAGTEGALLSRAILVVGASSRRDVLTAFQALHGQIRRFALVQLAWFSHAQG